MEVESVRRLTLLNSMLVKQALMDKMLRSVIEQSVSVFDNFVNRLGGDVITWFHFGLEKAYSDNLVDCAEAHKNVTRPVLPPRFGRRTARKKWKTVP